MDPAAGRPVGTGRGERLLRRVLAGTDPSPWALSVWALSVR